MVSQNRLAEQINRFKKQFLQQDQPGLMDLLNTKDLCKLFEQAAEEVPHILRERIWTPVVTVFAFVKQILARGGCSDAVTFVQAERARAGLEPCSDNTSAYCRARRQMPESLLWNLMRYAGRQQENESLEHWRRRGRAVKFVDGGTVHMSDTPENQAAYPQEPNQKEGPGFPLARIEIIASLRSGAVLDCGIGPCAGKGSGETALLRQMVSACFQVGDICQADKYYESFWHAAIMREQGVDTLSPVRGSRKIKREEGIQSGQDFYDRLFEFKKPARPERMTQEEYEKLPDSITVRIFRIYGRNYAATLLDPRKYRKNALRKLYQRRWRIEADLLFIKNVMEMEFLRSKTPEMARKEIAAALPAYCLIRMLIAQSAVRHGVWPRTLSFGKALSTFRELAGDLLKATGEEFLQLADKILKMAASAKLYKRKGRVEPREIKRRKTKKYPYQNTPRKAKNITEIPPKQNSYQEWFRGISGDAKYIPT